LWTVALVRRLATAGATTGAAAADIALGLDRADAVRTRLLESGPDPGLNDITSHGEADLLVPTADGVSESRNRRVEVTVR
jgi:outer membrane protein OmpA-like peptidoglycan-associated protein